jgi:hypothetical protein
MATKTKPTSKPRTPAVKTSTPAPLAKAIVHRADAEPREVIRDAELASRLADLEDLSEQTQRIVLVSRRDERLHEMLTRLGAEHQVEQLREHGAVTRQVALAKLISTIKAELNPDEELGQ